MMASNYYQVNPILNSIFSFLNKIFSIVFNFEMIVKLYALREEYFNITWNLFDMFIVVSADIGVLLEIFGLSKGFSTMITILRAFRILRIVRVLKRSKEV